MWKKENPSDIVSIEKLQTKARFFSLYFSYLCAMVSEYEKKASATIDIEYIKEKLKINEKIQIKENNKITEKILNNNKITKIDLRL